MEPVTLFSELWFESEPQLDLEVLAGVVTGATVAGDAPALAHPRFTFTYEGGEQSAILTAFFEPSEEHVGEMHATTEQTWDWEAADEVLARCTHQLMVAEVFGRVHAPSERLEAYLPTLCAAIDLLEPAAIWLPNSAKVANPAEILREPQVACVNVRLFRVEDSDECFMDTLGLHVLGLPEFQCRFRDEDPSAIAGFLYDCAGYLLDHGEVIEDGDTIGDRPWRCHFDMARVEPERRALTLSDA